jgi:hypothetical protein
MKQYKKPGLNPGLFYRAPYHVRGSKDLGLYCVFDESVEAGFLAGSGVLLDDFLGGRFVDGLDGFLQLILSNINFSSSDSFTSLFDSTFHDTSSDLVAKGVFGSNAHVFDG